jgi:hypothetical protein
VLDGEHVIQVDDEEFHLGPGGLAFGPRRVPDAQRRVVPRTGRILIMTSPAGFEEFFRELAASEGDGHSRAAGLRQGLREVWDHLAGLIARYHRQGVGSAPSKPRKVQFRPGLPGFFRPRACLG